MEIPYIECVWPIDDLWLLTEKDKALFEFYLNLIAQGSIDAERLIIKTNGPKYNNKFFFSLRAFFNGRRPIVDLLLYGIAKYFKQLSMSGEEYCGGEVESLQFRVTVVLDGPLMRYEEDVDLYAPDSTDAKIYLENSLAMRLDTLKQMSEAMKMSDLEELLSVLGPEQTLEFMADMVIR